MPSNNEATSSPPPTENDDTSHAVQVQKTQAQLEAIEQEIKETQALTSESTDISVLKQVYKSETSSKYFELGVDALAKTYGKLRTIRGDGNCYYRAFLYNLSEKMLENPSEWERVLKYGKGSA